jgi:alkylhydroperoxidase family enzyme
VAVKSITIRDTSGDRDAEVITTMARQQNPSDVPDRTRPAWIEVIPEDEADGELAALYDELRSPQTGRVDHVMAIHSLHPQSMRDHQQLYRTLMYGAGGLTRPEREMIGVVVSAVNRCHY